MVLVTTISDSGQSDNQPLVPRQNVTAFGPFLFTASTAVVMRRYGYRHGSPN